jgi:hypothetical protein
MAKISDAEMSRRLDDLATNPERALTPSHYQKTIQAFADFLDAQARYDEKPGFWRENKLRWHAANVKPGLERLQLAYQASYGPLDEVSGQQMFNILKTQAGGLGK